MTSSLRECKICGRSVYARGLPNHVASCVKKGALLPWNGQNIRGRTVVLEHQHDNAWVGDGGVLVSQVLTNLVGTIARGKKDYPKGIKVGTRIQVKLLK